jgi:hypothetical protein
MNRDDAVRDALERLADADSARRASPGLESALLYAFDRERARAAQPRLAWRSWRTAAALAAIPLAVTAYRELIGPGAPSPAHNTVPAAPQGVTIPRDATIGQVVQVRVPRSYLPMFGIPIVETEGAGSVNLQLVLTEDGQATSIRIVR